MIVLFHNTACGKKGNKLKSWLLLNIFPSDCIGLSYGAVTFVLLRLATAVCFLSGSGSRYAIKCLI